MRVVMGLDNDHIRIGKLEDKLREIDANVDYALKCVRTVGCATITLSLIALIISVFALEVF